MKRIAAIAALIIVPSLAWGQATVTQGGSWTGGHIPKYNQTGGAQPLVTDGGTAAGGSSGANPSTLGITSRGTGSAPYVGQGAGPNGENFCMYDGPTNAAAGYHSLCLDANVGNTAVISTQAGGGAAAQGLRIIVDGTAYTFPDDFPQIPVEVSEGGTGRTSLTDTNVVVGNGTSAVTLVAPSATAGAPLVSQGAGSDPVFGTASVAGGGTGATSFTANGVLYGNGTSAVGVTGTGTSGQPLLSQGAGSAPTYGTLGLSGGGTGATDQSGALENILPDQSGQNGKVLATDGATAAWTSIAGTGTVTSVATGSGLTGGPITTSGTIAFEDVADGSILANITGGAAPASANTLTAILDDQVGSARGTLLMRGVSAWSALTPGTSNLPLLSQGPGSDLAYGSPLINTLAISGQAQGDVIYFDGANWARLGAGTNGQFLQTQGAGANPQWAAATGVYEETYFTSNGTFTTPADSTTSTVYSYVVTAGGAGGTQSSGGATGGGGGAGETAKGTFTGVAANTGITITVGAGGAISTGGGDSSIGAPVSVTADGGNAGTNATQGLGGLGGSGGAGSAGLRVPGGDGQNGISASVYAGGHGGASFWGGGGRGATNAGADFAAGRAYGSGGGGGANTGSVSGGVGAGGVVVIKRVTR